LLHSDVEKMTRMVDLNATVPMRLAYAAAPGFVARGAIINIASIVAISPETLNGVYVQQGFCAGLQSVASA
jgi:short-subunit dehydrogenase